MTVSEIRGQACCAKHFFQLAIPADRDVRVLALAFSLPELWKMACRSVEDYCLEKNTNLCSPVAFRLVRAY